MKSRDLAGDKLFQVERKIAQRADQLSREFGIDRGHALDCWRQAEREFWDNADVHLELSSFSTSH